MPVSCHAVAVPCGTLGGGSACAFYELKHICVWMGHGGFRMRGRYAQMTPLVS